MSFCRTLLVDINHLYLCFLDGSKQRFDERRIYTGNKFMNHYQFAHVGKRFYVSISGALDFNKHLYETYYLDSDISELRMITELEGIKIERIQPSNIDERVYFFDDRDKIYSYYPSTDQVDIENIDPTIIMPNLSRNEKYFIGYTDQGEIAVYDREKQRIDNLYPTGGKIRYEPDSPWIKISEEEQSKNNLVIKSFRIVGDYITVFSRTSGPVNSGFSVFEVLPDGKVIKKYQLTTNYSVRYEKLVWESEDGSGIYYYDNGVTRYFDLETGQFIKIGKTTIKDSKYIISGRDVGDPKIKTGEYYGYQTNYGDIISGYPQFALLYRSRSKLSDNLYVPRDSMRGIVVQMLGIREVTKQDKLLVYLDKPSRLTYGKREFMSLVDDLAD